MLTPYEYQTICIQIARNRTNLQEIFNILSKFTVPKSEAKLISDTKLTFTLEDSHVRE